ncbi:MAG: hypothetical protein KJO21_11490 [Verrucomicrobiae bacterium]|nr:hypothetical protein [Verrucomicrobiae bacterium]NNJ42910.1 hypothetical protein [Akkermansiaceae bacterium]
MDPIESWLDAKEVRRIAESLMSPVPKVDQSAGDTGYGDDFEGFAEVPESDRSDDASMSAEEGGSLTEDESTRGVIGNTLADARRIAEGSGMLQARESNLGMPAALVPPEEVVAAISGRPTLSSLQALSAKLRRDWDARAIFVMDHEGEMVMDELENPKLIEVARTLADTANRATGQTVDSGVAGNLHIQIAARATLEIMPVTSRYGRLILGAIFPAPLGVERVRELAEMFHNAVESE